MTSPLIKPLHDNVLIRRAAADERSPGGLYIPEAKVEKETVFLGTVEAVGPGREDEGTGVVGPMPVAVGDRVLYSKYNATEAVRVLGKDASLVRASEILGIVEDG